MTASHQFLAHDLIRRLLAWPSRYVGSLDDLIEEASRLCGSESVKDLVNLDDDSVKRERLLVVLQAYLEC